MNPSYVQTFNRHRLLFSLPVVILTVLALWVVASTPKEYKAGASLFIDNPVTQESSFFNPNPSDSDAGRAGAAASDRAPGDEVLPAEGRAQGAADASTSKRTRVRAGGQRVCCGS